MEKTKFQQMLEDKFVCSSYSPYSCLAVQLKPRMNIGQFVSQVILSIEMWPEASKEAAEAFSNMNAVAGKNPIVLYFPKIEYIQKNQFEDDDD